MERVILEISHPYGASTERRVVSSGRVLIGRGYHCDIILDDPYVSEEHIEITLSAGERFLIADRGSVNGVFIGAKRLPAASSCLESGQEIKIGKTRIKIFSPHHIVHPARPHNFLSSVFQFCDRPLAGLLISVFSALFLVLLCALAESGDADFWKETAPGVGMGFFLCIWVVWAAMHLSLVIKHKKIMPWPRIISYLSALTLMTASFSILVAPYVEFYLLSPVPAMIFSGAAFLIFFLFFGYSFCMLCELPVKPVSFILSVVIVAALFLAIETIDVEYDSDPDFPETIITADIPLPSVQPLQGFIKGAFAEDSR
ncbi:MAG: FHA domain-containing protein [Micavibrio aeruginosavorus]|uniref:FHA domain-containing protein n=1 Tax=Micavibrio aeruginosavorus TaxID=349221 RepID=A0A7T5UFI5_9BACT|nr:MAG: FHA domain-containing protein [Micavibrio aeruginosavorus]